MDNKPVPRQEQSITEGMSREQIDLIKNTVARGATDNELKLFLYTANRTQLDPLTKQIHFIKRRVWNSRTGGYDEVGTIQTGIDGYRVVASRNGLAGIEDAVFDTEDNEHPGKASVTVYRMVNGTRVPFAASARWKEYAQTNKDGQPQAMWKKMPYLMLAKVAEALALRKAFPNDLSGIYTNEEMAQADTEPVIQVEAKPMEPYTVERKVPAADDEAGGNTEHAVYTQQEIEDMQKDEIRDLVKALKEIPGKKKVLELTGLESKPENYKKIIELLRAKVEATDPLSNELNK